jgi:hypothetical protein
VSLISSLSFLFCTHKVITCWHSDIKGAGNLPDFLAFYYLSMHLLKRRRKTYWALGRKEHSVMHKTVIKTSEGEGLFYFYLISN